MPDTKNVLSLSAIGLDSPGLVSIITSRVLELGGNILDVEETCRRGLFSIFLVIDFSGSDRPVDGIQSALKAIEEDTGLKVILGTGGASDIPDPDAFEHLLVTVLGVDRPGIIAGVSTLFHRYNANIESCRMIARGTFFSMEMIVATQDVRTDPPVSRADALERMKEELRGLCRSLNQSVVIQSETTYRQTKKIVVFDVESCLIREESARRFLAAVNERLDPLERRIDTPEDPGAWAQAVADRADLFEGIPVQAIEAAGSLLELHTGAKEVLGILKSMGYKVALLSTGFDCVLRGIYEIEDVDYAFCNTLRADDTGRATGHLEEPVLTAATKNEILEFIMSMEDIRRDQVVAVGDGSARSRFMKDVGLSIACKPGARTLPTDGIFSSDQMLNILYCLGVTESDIARYREDNPSGQQD